MRGLPSLAPLPGQKPQSKENRMLIAHLPVGYTVTRLYMRNQRDNFVLGAGLVGSVLPDIDLIYHVLLSDGRTPHHAYLTHIPIVWIVICAIMLLAQGTWQTTIYRAFLALSLNSLVHVALDTPMGGIMWLYPASNKMIYFFTLPKAPPHWIVTAMTHWTFRIEIALLALSTLFLFFQNKTESNE